METNPPATTATKLNKKGKKETTFFDHKINEKNQYNLGIYAFNSATLEPRAFWMVDNTFYQAKKRQLENRINAYQLKELSATLIQSLPEYNIKKNGEKTLTRVWHCGKTPAKNNGIMVDYVRGQKGKNYFSGLQHCASYWLCPVCAYKVAEQRAAELLQQVEIYRSQGKVIGFITLTAPHYKDESLKENTKFIIKGFDFCRQHRKVKTIFYPQYVRALEITYGKNGFHPHLHNIMIFDNKEQFDQYSEALKKLWINYITISGKSTKAIETRSFDAVTWDGKTKSITEYMTKFNHLPEQKRNEIEHDKKKYSIAQEMTKGQMKKANKGFTPFQILDSIIKGVKWPFEKDQTEIYKEYARDIKGHRMLQSSRGFFTKVETMTDEDIVKDDTVDLVIYSIHVLLWRKLISKSLIADIIAAYDFGGLPSVISVFERNNIKYNKNKRIFFNDQF
jgi:hypothetical protein